MKIKSIINLILVTLLCCSTTNALSESDDTYSYNYAALTNRCAIYDPYESLNRKIFVLNGFLDTMILRPIAKGYGRFTNSYTKDRVGSFVNNIKEPLSTVNYVAQGKGEGAFKTFWSFAINSTFGVAGLFDVASKFGLKTEPQTFGNTLAHYGMGSGPYIVLPLLGGTSARDAMDPIILNSLLNPVSHFAHKDFKYITAGVSVIHTRDQIMLFTDYVSNNSPDAYIAIRDAILNQRESKMDYPQNFKCPSVINK